MIFLEEQPNFEIISSILILIGIVGTFVLIKRKKIITNSICFLIISIPINEINPFTISNSKPKFK